MGARHSALSRVESARKGRSHEIDNQERFFKDPYQFARQLFQQIRSGSLSGQKRTTGDPPKKCNLIRSCSKRKFNNFPNLDEIRTVVQKARIKSAARPNGVPYLLYKGCPNIAQNSQRGMEQAEDR